MSNWFNITYPEFLRSFGIWKKFLCAKGFHLFDEVQSDTHYLYCDACELNVELKDNKTEQLLLETIDIMDNSLLYDELIPDEMWNSFFDHIRKVRKELGIINEL